MMPDAKLTVALIAAGGALAVAIFNHFSTRANQAAIQELQDAQKSKDARRDYEYEARKNLYRECGPVLFQLSELSESMYHRIMNLAGDARRGSLEPGSGSYLRDEYVLQSTLYRFLSPSAALKILQRRLTSVDLSLDTDLERRYILARQAFFSLGGEFTFAKLSDVPLQYLPFDERAEEMARTAPAIYWRQGLPLGVFEPAIEALLCTNEGGGMRVMTYPEFEVEYNKKQSRLHREFLEVLFLFEDFHPRTRPVLWRMLIAQACLYRALASPTDADNHVKQIQDLLIPESERPAFDWRSEDDKEIPDTEIQQPFRTAERYFAEKLQSRLERLNRRS